jgi:hypothetical protein
MFNKEPDEEGEEHDFSKGPWFYTTEGARPEWTPLHNRLAKGQAFNIDVDTD